jgi:DnaK suppressor protein
MSEVSDRRLRLLQKKREFDERLERIRRDLRHADLPLEQDFAEQAVQRENEEVLEQLQRATEAELQQIEHALARLAGGSPEDCEVCGLPIDERRLQLLPAATSCSDCAGLQQRRL